MSQDPFVTTEGSAGPGGTPRTFGQRVTGALRLDADVYEEVEHDPSAIGQAAAVVVLAGIAAGLANPNLGILGGLLVGAIGGLIGWFIGTAFIWFVGVRMMGGTSDYPELLRTLGFADAPGFVAILGLVPGLSFIAIAVSGLWQIIAYVIAARQALDVSTGRAVAVCVIAWLIALAVTLAIALAVGIEVPTEPGAMPG